MSKHIFSTNKELYFVHLLFSIIIFLFFINLLFFMDLIVNLLTTFLMELFGADDDRSYKLNIIILCFYNFSIYIHSLKLNLNVDFLSDKGSILIFVALSGL